MAKRKKSTRFAKTAPSPETPNESLTSPTPTAEVRGVEKEFVQDRPICRVTFHLPEAAAPEAKTVSVMGEFNEWSRAATPMRRQKNDGFSVSLELAKGRSYRFRYLIDGHQYENDWAADRYVPNPYGGDDSVIDL